MKNFLKISCIVFNLLFGVIQIHGQERTIVNTTIEFVVNTDVIIKNDNYYKFINETLPFLRENYDKCEGIVLIGSASPEGNKADNVRLANMRAKKLCSIINVFLPDAKFIISNDYDMFLSKTGFDESNYQKLRAVYFEVSLIKKTLPDIIRDTVYINRTDTILRQVNCFRPAPIDDRKPVFSVYNDLLGDLLFRANIGAELYFNNMSVFVEGSFSDWKFIGKTYDIDIWHIGFRKYFNNEYKKVFIETYINAGYFDTNLFSKGKVGILYGGGVGAGYAFKIGNHWKLSPIIRIGLFERVYYMDYDTGGGNIKIYFGEYIDWKLGDTGDVVQGNNENVIQANNVITKEFFNKCNKAYYIGPTYVGVLLKRDFCIKNKNKKIKYEDN